MSECGSKVFLPSFNNGVTQHWVESNRTFINPNEIIYPLFLSDQETCYEHIKNFPNQYRLGAYHIVKFLEPLVKKGLKSVLLFGSVSNNKKDLIGTYADCEESPVINGVKIIKKHFPELVVMCDVCLCAYTSHGNCGIIDESNVINNHKSIKRLGEISKSYAMAGCDVVAPSDMLDNRVQSINKFLRECDKRFDVSIMSYSAKFSSNLYGPFREACNSSFSQNKQRVNQLPCGASSLAIRAIERDIEEGADFVIVKPGLCYLDIIKEAKTTIAKNYPVIAYQVSGEYSMLYYAAQNNAFDLRKMVLESMVSFKRAGASAVITYFAPQILDWI